MDSTMFEQRTRELQQRMRDADVELALISDEDSIYYFSGYHGYLYMEFGRPTLLLVRNSGDVSIITPSMELEMARRMSWVASIIPWQDGVGGEWRDALGDTLDTLGDGKLGIEPDGMPPVVHAHLDRITDSGRLIDLSAHVVEMRMVKSDAEIQLARHAAEVAIAMMHGGREAIAEGVPEYEVVIATMTAGTRKAALLLETQYELLTSYPKAIADMVVG